MYLHKLIYLWFMRHSGDVKKGILKENNGNFRKTIDESRRIVKNKIDACRVRCRRGKALLYGQKVYQMGQTG